MSCALYFPYQQNKSTGVLIVKCWKKELTPLYEDIIKFGKEKARLVAVGLCIQTRLRHISMSMVHHFCLIQSIVIEAAWAGGQPV